MILQRHPFVQERFAAATEALRVDDSDVLDSLTEPLSESREFTKQNVGPKSYFFLFLCEKDLESVKFISEMTQDQ